MKGAFVLMATLLLAADDPKGVRWTFGDAQVGQLPEGWASDKTGEGPGSVWKIVTDETAIERIPGTSPAQVLISNIGDASLGVAEVSSLGKLKLLDTIKVGAAPKRVAFLP